MKNLIFSLLVLLSISLSAQIYTSTFRGEFFDQDNQAACNLQLNQLLKRADELGINVLESQCANLENGFRPEFIYSFGVGHNIEVEQIKLSKDVNCQELKEKANIRFKESQLKEVFSFCARGKLVLNYLRNYSYMREFNFKLRFKTQKRCLEYLKSVEEQLPQSASPVVSYCQKRNNSNGLFMPSMNYESKRENISEITGRPVESRELCLGRANELSERLNKAGLSFIKSSCEPTITAKSLRESVLFMKPTTTYFERYMGLKYKTEAQCMESVENLKAHYNANGKEVFYEFCHQTLNDNYRARLFFIRETL